MNTEQKEFYNAQIGSPLQIAIKDNEPLQKQIEEMIEACKKMVIAEERARIEKAVTEQFKYGYEHDNYDMRGVDWQKIIHPSDLLSSLSKPLTDN